MDALLDKSFRRSLQFAAIGDSGGTSIVFEFARPENHRRLSEMEWKLLDCFSSDKALAVTEGIDAFRRLSHIAGESMSTDALLATLARLNKLGALVECADTPGPYSREMCFSYARSRQVPPEIAATIVAAVNLERATGVLDLGCGTGSLAIQLGLISADVTGADISHEFLEVARAAAHARGSHAAFVRLDGNRLVFARRNYDVIAASQVLHWLDPSLAVRGLNRALRPDGSLFTVETKGVLWARHPLRRLLGFGNLRPTAVLKECMRHARATAAQLAHLTPPVPGFNLSGMWVFRQSRTFDMDFARAYFFPNEMRSALPGHPSPQDALRDQLAAMPAHHARGDLYWLLLHFTRQTSLHAPRHSGRIVASEIIDIPYNPD